MTRIEGGLGPRESQPYQRIEQVMQVVRSCLHFPFKITARLVLVFEWQLAGLLSDEAQRHSIVYTDRRMMFGEQSIAIMQRGDIVCAQF